MSIALLVPVLLAAGAGDLRPARFAAPGLSVVNVDPAVGRFYTEHVAQQLKLLGLEIVTMKEIESLLGMERQRQLLGCDSNSSSCIAELANALGTDGVLLGDIARLGARYTVNLKIIGGEDGRTLAVFSGNASSDEEVVDTLTRGARTLALDATKKLGRAPPRLEVQATASSAPAPYRKLAIVPGALAIVAVGVGIGLLVWSNADYNALKTGMPGAAAQMISTRGQTTAPVGVGALVFGGVALGTAVLLFLLGHEAPVAVGVGAGGGGAGLVFSGAWP